jgi:hypothetical protein
VCGAAVAGHSVDAKRRDLNRGGITYVLIHTFSTQRARHHYIFLSVARSRQWR